MRVAGALWEDVTDAVRYGLKSMLNPRSKAPHHTLAQELYDSIPGDDGDAMTRRAMAMKQFQYQGNVVRRVSRAPRWR
jgi:hypothetical protein